MTDHNPDWARVGARAPDQFAKLGDPTRWGGTVKQETPAGPILPANGLFQAAQIMAAQCRDPYSRAWTIAGTLTAPNAFFNLADDGSGVDSWAVALYVSMGVGQIQIVHSFNLREIVLADLPYYWNSDLANPFRVLSALTDFVSVPFIIPGAVVGNAINAQLLQRLTISTPFPASQVTVSAIMTPFDPGANK